MKKGFTKSYMKATELQKISAIAVPSNDTHSAIVHVPCSWSGLKVFAMTSEFYNQLRGKKIIHNNNSTVFLAQEQE
ncbi:MAG TPA: hypothetical protein VEH06_11875 [Candidatus Bathyarchaeia archaeon]|nr:hypothetical protein [Candidatus Bathyarchaeia archaeon]